MEDVAIIRSMTNKEGNHQRATYQLHTGYAPSGTVKHPGFGCVVGAELGDPKFDLPHIVSIGTRDNGPGQGAGLLGVKYEPFLVPDPLKPPLNVALPVPSGPVHPPAQPDALARSRRVRQFGRARPGQGAPRRLQADGQHGPLAAHEGLRRRGRGRQDPRPLRQHPVRPGLPAGPAAGRGRRDLRRGPLQRLGQPRQGHRRGGQERRLGRPRLRLAGRRPQVARDARRRPWSSGWASSAGPPRSTRAPAATTSPGSSAWPWPAGGSRGAR